jgi:hypothetical protein
VGVSTESAGAGSFGGTFSAEPTIRYSSAASRPRCALWSDASSVAKVNTETGVDCGRGSGGPSEFHVLYLLRRAIAEFLWDHDEDRLSIRASTDRHRDLPKSDRADASRSEVGLAFNQSGGVSVLRGWQAGDRSRRGSTASRESSQIRR